MAQETRPVLSVIVRRFRREYAADIEASISRIQSASAQQPGFLALQNSITPKQDDFELVTILTFDTPENLEAWENSSLRKRYAEDLDKLSQDHATNTNFGDLAALVHPAARISKLETVLFLIAWILILNQLLTVPIDLLLPVAIGSFWQGTVQTTIIVTLISYVLLPFSSVVLSRLKARL